MPDVTFFRRERIPIDPSGEVADEFFLPADIAVEIISPKQSVTGLVRRCIWYVENGVEAALLVDERDRSVLVFRPGQAPLAVRGAERIVLDDVLAGFELTPEELFASLKIG